MKHHIAFACSCSLIAGTVLSATISIEDAVGRSANRTVKSGQKTAVDRFFVYDVRSCATLAPPKISFRQTSHGKLSWAKKKIRWKTEGKCKGQLVSAVYIYYTSNRGYRGSDKGKVIYKYSAFSDGTGHSYNSTTLNLNVK